MSRAFADEDRDLADLLQSLAQLSGRGRARDRPGPDLGM